MFSPGLGKESSAVTVAYRHLWTFPDRRPDAREEASLPFLTVLAALRITDRPIRWTSIHFVRLYGVKVFSNEHLNMSSTIVEAGDLKLQSLPQIHDAARPSQSRRMFAISPAHFIAVKYQRYDLNLCSIHHRIL